MLRVLPRTLLSLALGLLGPACLRHRFEPVQPRSVESAQGRYTLEQLELAPLELWVQLAAAAPGGSALQGATLAPEQSAPCTAGLAASALVLDGVEPWARPAALAALAQVRLKFPDRDALELLVQPTALDLRLQQGREEVCLRLPLTGAAPARAWRFENRWFTGLGGTYLRSAGGATRWDQGAAHVRVGRWLGPARVWGELGGTRGGALEAALATGVLPLRWGRWATTLSAGYALSVPGSGPLAHGPRAALGLAFGAPDFSGLPGGARRGSLELELPVTYRFAADGAAAQGLALGAGLSLNLAL